MFENEFSFNFFILLQAPTVLTFLTAWPLPKTRTLSALQTAKTGASSASSSTRESLQNQFNRRNSEAPSTVLPTPKILVIINN